MITIDTAGVEQTAARAALAVPGVEELQPSLRHSLADAATYLRRTFGSRTPSPEAGIHASHTPETDAWHLEVRCVLNAQRRALDTARDVRESVQAAVSSQLNSRGRTGSVTIVVTVTRITGGRAPLHLCADL
ncbi:Asp23/Gls24 family envelope stress response protein [Streptomyces sp. NEAU-S7GS2]|uniref:Asp23/Gls24 family envelope stress response protein n=1 Tax=unclassified Streptomyces TaxID=2593676 RepID=UPI000D6EF45B|nr:Asp23/Gls24 family envelope stress response protein [Streptomyces sp. NEAU-S7GS2]AWN30643.1 hypothetical protein DKG71_35175 [Streptomyces sp. NEAU-S7GS2]